jgi:hypothetical protein
MWGGETPGENTKKSLASSASAPWSARDEERDGRVRPERRSAGQKKGEEDVDAEEVMQGGRGREEGRSARGQEEGEEAAEEGDGDLELRLVTTGMLTYADVC